ncbi:4'-phosphopantetheinyl transferase superfamily protein [Streptomyces sp. WAC06614]|nr:4'-phosphopantetheinyl transferase superfamily protein [Streptomyces sp. WAC06614]
MKSVIARAEFVTCRAAVKRALSQALDVPAGEISLGRLPCPGCGSVEHGPPAVRRPATTWRYSVAHSAGIGMLALSPFRVGVDVERRRTLDIAGFDDPVLTSTERRALYALPEGDVRTSAFLRCWTRKEAVLKAVGIGVAAELTALETGAGGPADSGVTCIDTTPIGFPGSWRTTDLAVPEDWVASIALPAGADRPPTVRRL